MLSSEWDWRQLIIQIYETQVDKHLAKEDEMTKKHEA